MAYCKKCGAYIPDNQNTCFACGYNEAAQTEKSAEEARRSRQQANREWAEAEKERRSREQKESAGSATTASKIGNSKLVATMSYIGILCVVGLLLGRNDKFVNFHAKQGLVLLLFEIAGGIAGAILSVGWIVRLFAIYCMVMGIINAQKGQMKALPLLGKLKLF